MSIMAWSKMKKIMAWSKMKKHYLFQIYFSLLPAKCPLGSYLPTYIYKGYWVGGFDCEDDSWRSVSGKASECTLLLDREVPTWIVKCMFPGSGFLDNVRAK